MTSVLAVDAYLTLVVVADCRVTWEYPKGKFRLQDNLQKIYQFGPTGVLGFAGGIAAAQAVFHRFSSHPLTSLPDDVFGFVSYIGDSARIAYSELPEHDQIPLELTYAAVNYGRIFKRLENATLAEHVLISYGSPNFVPIRNRGFVRLGYAKKLDPEKIDKDRMFLTNFALNPAHLGGQLHFGVRVFGHTVAQLAPNPVGGLFTACVIRAEGVGWGSYSHDENYSIEFNNPSESKPYQYLQRDLKQNKEVPLQSIAAFDVRNPDPRNLKLDPPF